MAWSRSRCSAATAQTRCWGCAFYALFSPGRKVVFPDITYSFYPVYTELFGLDYEEIPSTRTSPLPVERFLRGERRRGDLQPQRTHGPGPAFV